MSFSASTALAACDADATGFGISRIVEIDTSHGPLFGSFTKQARKPSFLNPKEVVLTFDDGPMPWITKSILDTLDKYCAKATFFSVGRMALAYPDTVKDIVARGHTLGTHTYSHPFNMPLMKADAAATEIERGIAAVSTAAGVTVAPFFRFTGLSDSNLLLGYLQTRGIATFTVDVVSNDSYIGNADTLAERTLSEIAKTHGGIVLFHDIKASTARALPVILRRLKASGYRIVHMKAKTTAEPLAEAMLFAAPKLAKVSPGKTMLPFYGAIGPVPSIGAPLTQTTEISPAARDRSAPAKNAHRKKYSSKARAHSELDHEFVEAEAEPPRAGGRTTEIESRQSPGKRSSTP